MGKKILQTIIPIVGATIDPVGLIKKCLEISGLQVVQAFFILFEVKEPTFTLRTVEMPISAKVLQGDARYSFLFCC